MRCDLQADSGNTKPLALACDTNHQGSGMNLAVDLLRRTAGAKSLQGFGAEHEQRGAARVGVADLKKASYRRGERTQKAGREAVIAVPPLSFVNKDDISGTEFNLDFRQTQSGKVLDQGWISCRRHLSFPS